MTKRVGELKVPCEVYSRVVGYLRPVQSWHAGKKQEFKDRVVFDMSEALTEEEKEEKYESGCLSRDLKTASGD